MEKESFLGILKEYFGELDESKILIGNKEKIQIPMDWIYTDKLERSVIKNAFINMFCKTNKDYKWKLKQDKDLYGKIPFLDIEKGENGINLGISSMDGWTKILVTEDRDLRGPFYAIDEERLNNEILRSFNYKSTLDVCRKYNLGPEEREKFIEELQTPEKLEARKEIVEAAMIDAAHNLTKYYEYMIQKKMKYEALTGTVQQRKDQRDGRGTGHQTVTTPRISDIYDLSEREKVLEEMNPSTIINIDNIEDDGTIRKFAYTTYVYANPRGKEGFLFVAEPYEGTHNTRVRFISQGEFDKLQVKEGENKFVNLAEKITEMSNSEFSATKYAKVFKHTSIEKHKEKFRRIVLGEKTNSTEEYRYAEIDRILFDGERKIGGDTIKAKIEGITPEDIANAREALYARPENTKDVSQKH